MTRYIKNMNNQAQQPSQENKTVLIVRGVWMTSLFLTEYINLKNKNIKVVSSSLRDVLAKKIYEGHLNLIINVITPREVEAKYQITQKLKEQYIGVPVIVNGAMICYADVAACYKAGCELYLPLPIDLGILDETLEKYLGG